MIGENTPRPNHPRLVSSLLHCFYGMQKRPGPSKIENSNMDFVFTYQARLHQFWCCYGNSASTVATVIFLTCAEKNHLFPLRGLSSLFYRTRAYPGRCVNKGSLHCVPPLEAAFKDKLISDLHRDCGMSETTLTDTQELLQVKASPWVSPAL